jgi:hypothetical protein
MASNCNMSDLGYVRDYLLSNTKTVFWINCKCEISAYLFSERPGVNVFWNNADKFTGMEQSN